MNISEEIKQKIRLSAIKNKNHVAESIRTTVGTPHASFLEGVESGYVTGAEWALTEFGSGMKWIKASDRLPEFKNRKKLYVIRYVGIPDELEIWNWDSINEREAAAYEFEWLSESEPTKEEGKVYEIEEVYKGF